MGLAKRQASCTPNTSYSNERVRPLGHNRNNPNLYTTTFDHIDSTRKHHENDGRLPLDENKTELRDYHSNLLARPHQDTSFHLGIYSLHYWL